MKNQYDFIIVGGGTSGIITATKLVGANTNAPAMAIADKATDLLLNE
ncbi:hypothetical protein OAI01_03305 [Alphaproteobacteria bacterium]|nr:hypothetical protein [Alphaproteobacteria bacterium]